MTIGEEIRAPATRKILMSTDMVTIRSRGLSLKATLTVVFGTLAILVLTACGIAGAEAWRGYVGAGRVAQVNANTDLLLKSEMSGNAKIYCGKQRIITLMTRRLVRYVRVEFWSLW